MQETRKQILEALRDHGDATVDDLVILLRNRRKDSITAVTVRHHLNELLKKNLIQTTTFLHRNSPGGPQHVYALTGNALEHFPDNYRQLAAKLLSQIHYRLPDDEVNVIMEGIAQDMADEAGISAIPMAKRLDQVVEYLNQNGYEAEWKKDQQDYILITYNCPYHEIAQQSDHICKMDLHFISAMLGVVPRMSNTENHGNCICRFRIPISIN